MPRKQKKYHYIYKTTCQVTGKFYVGMHSTDNLEDGYLGSGKILGYSRAKHGDENHKKEILEFLPDRTSLKKREAEVVNEALLADPLCINLKYGGEGGWDHIITTPFRDHSLQQELSKRGNASLKEKWKSMRPIDVHWQESIRMKLSRAVSPGFTFTGKNHSQTTKLKIAEKLSLKQHGEKNSQFGTCWVTNGVKPIKIKKEQLDEYLANGYRRGRK